MADLVVENLTKSYEKVDVLRGVNFTLPQGAVLCLAGPSGGGKTTLLNILCGLLLPDGGQVRHGNKILSTHNNAVAPWRRDMAMAFQTPALFPHMTVLQNLNYAATKNDTALVSSLCAAFSIEDVLNSLPQNLSGGQAKRVELARALAAKPKILLLDEPTTHLDPSLQSRVISTVLNMAVEWSSSVLYVTHSREEAAMLDAPTIQLCEGKVTQ